MDIPIIYQDKSLLVVDKPWGVVVNRSETQRGETVQDWVRARWGEVEGVGDFYERSGIVHRLDKDTSGILIIAKNLEAFGELQRQFKFREVEKEYVALVHGKMLQEEIVVNAPLGRNPRNRIKWAIVQGGRESTTAFSLISQFTNEYGDFSLIKCVPTTGRTHQIRVHLASMRMPIVADVLYAGRKRHKIDGKWCPRMFLHATRLSLTHPTTGKRVTFASKLPKELLEIQGGSTP
ncbi:MAG: RluA family pseudouridine synthase [Patescibacteria group bacterium]